VPSPARRPFTSTPAPAPAPASTLLVLATIAMLTWTSGCANIQSEAATPQPAAARDGALIHIKSGPADVHAVLMGLQMARTLASEGDVAVRVYLDVEAVVFALAEPEVVEMEPFGASDQIVAQLLARDVRVLVCPGCLKAAGKTPADLMPGAEVATKAALFDLAPGRIVTLDY